MNKVWDEQLAQSQDRLEKRRQNKDRIKGYLIKFGLAVLILGLWYPQYWKRLIYPSMYGKYDGTPLTISETDSFQDLPNNASLITLERHGKLYQFKPRTKYSVTGKVGYVDTYDGFWNRFYRKQSQEDYINIVPLDLIIVINNMAKPEIYNLFDFFHEERSGGPRCKGVKYRTSFFSGWMTEDKYRENVKKYNACNPYIRAEEFNNYHPIPANNNIDKALHTILPGDTIYIEGILVDVPMMGMKTGTRKQQHHDYLVSGYNPGMCFILYTTKIILNNHIYE